MATAQRVSGFEYSSLALRLIHPCFIILYLGLSPSIAQIDGN